MQNKYSKITHDVKEIAWLIRKQIKKIKIPKREQLKMFNWKLKSRKETNVIRTFVQTFSFFTRIETGRKHKKWGIWARELQKGGYKTRETRRLRCLGALTTAEHLWASCARRRHTAPRTWPPPWGRSGRTPRSRARSPGGLTCGGQTWCCWVSRSARLPPLPATIAHRLRHSRPWGHQRFKQNAKQLRETQLNKHNISVINEKTSDHFLSIWMSKI